MQDVQLTNVDFELDVNKGVDYYNKNNKDIMEFGVILDECKRCCNLYFAYPHVKFSQKQIINDVVHITARETTL